MRKVNLIPMAGTGLRFKKQGYKLPKPLIKINNTPMFVNSVRSLPNCDLLIFICLKEHILKFNIDKHIKNYFPKAKIISLVKKTKGQVSSCLKAKKYLRPNDCLTIGSCDYSMKYNKKIFKSKLINSDLIVWTFKDQESIKKNPYYYGYVKSNKFDKIINSSCKIPLSNKPWNDDVIIGTFTFKRAKDFIKYAELLIKKKIKVNNEYYIDSIINYFIGSKLLAKKFKVSKFNGWGTPFELKRFLSNKNV